MKAARIIFLIAGIWGILSLAPDFFLERWIGEHYPPPLTHPQFFYGFVGIAFVFQFIFLLIARDPGRYRPLMLVSILEKASWVIPCAVLYAQGRAVPQLAATGIGDFILGILFSVAYAMTRPKLATAGAR